MRIQREKSNCANKINTGDSCTNIALTSRLIISCKLLKQQALIDSSGEKSNSFLFILKRSITIIKIYQPFALYLLGLNHFGTAPDGFAVAFDSIKFLGIDVDDDGDEEEAAAASPLVLG
jgi:hypothetical protein